MKVTLLGLLLLPVAAPMNEIGTLFEEEFDSSTTDFFFQPDIFQIGDCSTDEAFMWGGHHRTTFGKGLHKEFVDLTSGGLKLGLMGGLEPGGSCGNVGFEMEFQLDYHVEKARIKFDYRPKVSPALHRDPTPGGELHDHCEIRVIVDGRQHQNIRFSADSEDFPHDESWRKMDVNAGELHAGNHQVQIALVCLTLWSDQPPFAVRFDNFKIVEVSAYM